jgi:hypothetical protein
MHVAGVCVGGEMNMGAHFFIIQNIRVGINNSAQN